ncbi:MAG: MaoC family dehydratase N-terminal domain-containing protein [Bacteroidales bacterium]|nr:MaoC family dehydratase N-terminal domain-containing protein [Bacteroidales bacterium]
MDDLQIFNRPYSHTFRITQEQFDLFRQMSADQNPLHTDPTFAQQHGFASNVVYGNVLGSCISYFVGMLLPLKNVVIHQQQIAYHKPVFVGDTLAFEAKVSNIFESVGVVEFKFTFRNQGNNMVAKGTVQIGLI